MNATAKVLEIAAQAERRGVEQGAREAMNLIERELKARLKEKQAAYRCRPQPTVHRTASIP